MTPELGGARAAAGLVVLLAIGIATEAVAGIADDVAPRDQRKFQRDGFTAGIGLGTSALVGTGKRDGIRGFGGAVSLRFGTAATRRIHVLLMIDAAQYIKREGEGDEKTLKNNLSIVSLGVQYAIKSSLWWRGGLGVATSREATMDGGGERKSSGLSGVLAIGLELYQKEFWAVDVALVTSASAFDEGWVFHTGLVVELAAY